MRKIIPFLVFIFLVCTLNAQTFNGNAGSSVGAIPDSGKAIGATCFPLTVSGLPNGGIIDSTYGLASVTINITHPYDADLVIKLKAPDGTIIILSNQNGSSKDNYTGTIFTATAPAGIAAGSPPFTGNFLPEGGNLGAVNNKQNADGIWSLCIEDVNKGNTGTLDNWSMTFNNTPALAPPPIPACISNATAINTCVDAPFVCNLDGFCGSTSASFSAYEWTELTNTFYSCKHSTIQNNSFIRFVASATSASFDVWVYNSKNGDGIQMMFFNDVCNAGKVISYGCTHQIPIQSTPFLISAKGLTIGQTYYLMFDGYGGDVCNYTIKAVSGVNVVNIALTPDSTTICKGEKVQLNASGGSGTTYSWNTSTTPTTANSNSALSSTNTSNPILNTSLLQSTVSYDTITLTGTAVGACPATSTSIIHLVDIPVVTSSATTQSGLAGFVPTALTVSSSTTGVTYQWYVSRTNSYTGTAIAGATATSYTPPTSSAGTFYYYCLVSNGGCVTQGNINTVIVNPVPSCAPDTLAFLQQPTNTAQSSAMTPAVTIKVFCKANGINATSSYTGPVTITAKDGCGFKSITYNVMAADNGIATFDTIKFSRSIQNGVSLIATAQGITSSSTSDTFSITAPTGGGGGTTTTTKIITSNDFETPLVGKWGWVAGTPTFPADDIVGIDCHAGNCYLRKSDNGTYASGKSEDKNTITFSNLTNLSKYTNLILSFKLASLSDVGAATPAGSADSGPGTDTNEDMVVETSTDGGTSWKPLLTHNGSGNRLFPFASTPVTTLALGAGVTYTTGQDNSAFKVDITGNSQFQLKITATDNRFSENWCMDDISLIGDTTITSKPATSSPLPTVIAGNDTTICNPGTASLFSTVSNGVGTIKYTWSPSTGLTNATDSTLANPSATKLIANQAYKLSIVDGDNCPATANPVNVIVNKKPSLTSQSTATQTVCIGSALNPLSVVAANTETFQWYSNVANSTTGGTLIVGATTPSYTPSSAAAGTTYYYCELSGACTPKVTSNVSGAIIVTATNTIVLSSAAGTDAQTPCVNTAITNITYTTTGATGATFSGLPAGVTGSLSSNTVTITGTPTAAGNNGYTITLTGGCGVVNATGTINVNATPTAPAVSITKPTCTNANGSVAITSTTTGLTFSTNGTNYASYSAAYTVAAGGTYSVTAKSAGGCISSATTGTMDKQPTSPTQYSVTGGGNYCSNANGLNILLSNSDTGVNYQLLVGGANTGSPVAGTGSSLSFPNQSTTGIYTVVATNATGGCTSNMKDSAVIAHKTTQTLSVSIAATKDTLCAGEPISVAASATNAGSASIYQWKIQNNIVQTGSSSTYTTTALKDGDSVTCLLSTNAACLMSDSAYSNKITFKVNSVSSVALIKSATDSSVCQAMTKKLSDATKGGKWKSADTTIATIDSTSGMATGVAGGLATISYSLTNICGTTTQSFPLTVIKLIKVDSIMGDSIVCKGSTINLTDATIGGTWSSDNKTIDSVNTKGVVTGLAVGNSSIRYVIKNICNADTAIHAVKVVGSKLDSKVPTIKQPTCVEAFSGSLNISIAGTESPYTLTFNGHTYNPPTTINGISEGAYNIDFYNYAGCLVDSLTNIFVTPDGNCDTLYVPTGFLPSSNTVSGKNNLLKPFGGSLSTITSLLFRIYNRWGSLVFTSHDIYSGWDGMYNGVAQGTDTFVWYLDYSVAGKLNPIHLKGTSVLIR